MKKYKEIRTINAATLHNLCIENGWYTLGNKNVYWHLYFDLVRNNGNLKTEDIIAIALDIMEHSEIAESYTVEDIASEVARVVRTTFVEV